MFFPSLILHPLYNLGNFIIVFSCNSIGFILCLYFIYLHFSRGIEGHIGLFFFYTTLLERCGSELWSDWESDISDIESLEQNRFVDMGIPVKMIKIKHNYFGIDVKEQVDTIEKRRNEIQ